MENQLRECAHYGCECVLRVQEREMTKERKREREREREREGVGVLFVFRFGSSTRSEPKKITLFREKVA